MTQGGKVLGLILAGGKARRFGRDKRLVELGGKPLISHAIDRLAPQVHQLVLSSNDPVPGGDGLIHLADQVAEQGPILGIAEGLAFASDKGFDWLVTAPADSPFVPNDLVPRLIDPKQSTPIRFAQSADQRHPIFGAWSTSLVQELWALIAEGERKIDRAADRLGGYDLIDWPIDSAWGDPFFNINRPEDLERAAALYPATNS